MLILDTCVGAAKMYKGREKLLKDSFISIDIRKGDFTLKVDEDYNRTSDISQRVADVPVIIKPHILANMKYLPFKEKIFDVIICDPPHLIGTSGFMVKQYGGWKDKNERIVTFYRANIEFARVLKDNGTVILKIMPDQVNSYEQLLTNFIFYLPIQTIRQQGCINTKESKLAAIWLIGIKKDN